MGAYKGLKSAVVMLFTMWYLVAGAYFGLSMLAFPLCVLIRPFNRRVYYQYVVPLVFGNYWYSTLCVLEWLNGTRVRIYGEVPRPVDATLVVCNHKCDLDYCYLWSAVARAGNFWKVGLFKAVLKSSIKFVPVFAWGLKACGFLYLSRSWESDKANIKNWSVAMSRDKVPMWLVLYPEGTRFTERKREKSEAHAREKGIEPYKSELLVPRTKGLIMLLQSLAESYFPSVLEMTIAYAKRDGTLLKGSELGTSALKKVFSGDSPVGTVHIHFRHHKIEDIPTEDEKVSKWAMDMWRTKDDLLQTLQTTGSFPGQPLPVSAAPPKARVAARVVFFMLLILVGTWGMMTSRWWLYYQLTAVTFGYIITFADPMDF